MTDRMPRLGLICLACGLLWLLPLTGADLQKARAQTPPAKPAVVAAPAAWSQLDAHQQQALAPLRTAWPQLTPSQRSKWLALSGSFGSLSSEERQLVHDRMTDWASLSPQERARARLNYSHLQAMSRDERKARWAQYQALSDEEKRRLQRRHASPKSAAPASRPTPARAERLVQPPNLSPSAQSPAASQPIDRKTLLPRPGGVPAESLPAAAAGPGQNASTATAPLAGTSTEASVPPSQAPAHNGASSPATIASSPSPEPSPAPASSPP